MNDPCHSDKINTKRIDMTLEALGVVKVASWRGSFIFKHAFIVFWHLVYLMHG